MSIDKLNLYYKEERKSPITELYNNLIHEFKDIPQLPDEIKATHPHYQMLIDDSIGNLINIISGKVKDNNFLINIKDVGATYFWNLKKEVKSCTVFKYRCKHPKLNALINYYFTIATSDDSLVNLDIENEDRGIVQSYIDLNTNYDEYKLILFNDDFVKDKSVIDVFSNYFDKLKRAIYFSSSFKGGITM